MRIRLLPQTTIDAAVSLFDLLGHNAYGEAMPVGSSHPEDVRDAYVRWATSAERQLSSIMSRKDSLELIETPRHRDICSMSAASQMTVLISAEVEMKSRDLIGLAEDLRSAKRRMAGSGFPIIPDTHIFLHYQRPDSVSWVDVVGEATRLIIPLRVLEELDAKKYDAPRKQTRQAARDTLSWLERSFSGGGTGPVSVGSNTAATLEIYLADSPRWRPQDADEEILEVCHEVRLLAGRAKILTGDNGFRLRARAAGEEICDMPEIYLRLREEGQDARTTD
jgi:hypothetical protein